MINEAGSLSPNLGDGGSARPAPLTERQHELTPEIKRLATSSRTAAGDYDVTKACIFANPKASVF
jgi:hypothetical protein